MRRRLHARDLVLFGLPGLGLLLGLVGYLVLVAPAKSRAGRLGSQVEAARAAIVTKPATSAATATHPPVEASQVFALARAMPDSDDMPGILTDLSRLARRSGVSLQTVQPQAEAPTASGYAVLPLTVSLDGSFAHVSRFLSLLRGQVQVAGGHVRTSGRLLVPGGVQLASPDGKTVTATLALDAFVYGVAPPAAAATATTTTKAAG